MQLWVIEHGRSCHVVVGVSFSILTARNLSVVESLRHRFVKCISTTQALQSPVSTGVSGEFSACFWNLSWHLVWVLGRGCYVVTRLLRMQVSITQGDPTGASVCCSAIRTQDPSAWAAKTHPLPHIRCAQLSLNFACLNSAVIFRYFKWFVKKVHTGGIVVAYTVKSNRRMTAVRVAALLLLFLIWYVRLLFVCFHEGSFSGWFWSPCAPASAQVYLMLYVL
jgi:hypothetical protein